MSSGIRGTHVYGPLGSSQALRWPLDSRDEGRDVRLDAIDSMEEAWSCEFIGACSKVRPKGVDPAGAIQRLKIMLSTGFLESFWERLVTIKRSFLTNKTPRGHTWEGLY